MGSRSASAAYAHVMESWTSVRELFDDVAACMGRLRSERQHREQAAREQASWYAHTEAWVMNALRDELEERISQLGTAQELVHVVYPAAAPLTSAVAGSMRFLSVDFAGQVVTAYSHANSVSLTLHWGWQVRARRDRFPRIVSVPGVRVLPGSGGEPLCRWVDPARAGATAQLEEVAARLLWMLGGAAASQCRAASSAADRG